MAPEWLTVLAWVALAVAGACAAEILADVHAHVRGYRQRMRVMEAVWPVTALYFGPLATVSYRRWGRPVSHRWRREHGSEPPDKPFWATVAVGVSHRGAGCTLGDVVAETAVFLAGWSLLGLAQPASGSSTSRSRRCAA